MMELKSLRGMASSETSCSGYLVDRGIGMNGSTRARVSVLRGGVSFGSQVSTPEVLVSFKPKPGGDISLSPGCFGSVVVGSFSELFYFSDDSSTLSLSSIVLAFFSLLGSAMRHHPLHSNLSSLGSWPRTIIFSLWMWCDLMHSRTFSKVIVSSKKESSGYTSWWYYVTSPNF